MVQLTGLIADTCGGTGIYLGSGGGTVQGVTIANGWSSSNNIGMEIDPAPLANQITYGLSRFLNNKTSCVVNYGATNVEPFGNYMDKP